MFFTALAASAAVANENLGFLIVIRGLLFLFAPICPTSGTWLKSDLLGVYASQFNAAHLEAHFPGTFSR